jgi:hypothetical protein
VEWFELDSTDSTDQPLVVGRGQQSVPTFLRQSPNSRLDSGIVSGIDYMTMSAPRPEWTLEAPTNQELGAVHDLRKAVSGTQGPRPNKPFQRKHKCPAYESRAFVLCLPRRKTMERYGR